MRKPLGVRQCANCGADIEIFHKKRMLQDIVCCSIACANEYKKKKGLNCVCCVCGKKFHLKPYQARKYSKHEHCCSYECLGKYRSKIYAGSNNPNYGNRGMINPMCKGERTLHMGYWNLLIPNHPFSNSGRVREHRYIAEQYLLTPENTIRVDGKEYLSPLFDVHHINGDKLDNRVDNLMVLTRSEHAKLHAELRRQSK